MKEARTAAKIRHPNVVSLLDVGVDGEVPYLVMELLEGVLLSRYLQRASPLSVDESIDTILPIVSAVAAAHAMGIVHRDLKPGNVMLCRRRPGEISPTVLDFGISKQFGEGDTEEEQLTNSGIVLGTIPYLAPEQTRGGRFASPRSDQYAVALILYECVTGARPFVGEGVYETMHAIVTAPLTPPSRRVEGVPRELDAVVVRALERDPEKRYPSMNAFGAALLDWGRRRTRETWVAVFAPQATDAIAEPTAHDVRAHDGPARALPIASTRRRYAWPAVAVTLAAALALAGARHRWSAPETLPAAPSARELAVATSPSIAPTPPTPSTSTASHEPSTSASTTEVARSAPAPTTPDLSAAPPRPRPTPSKHASAPSVPAGPPPPAAGAVLRGTNGAQIFD